MLKIVLNRPEVRHDFLFFYKGAINTLETRKRMLKLKNFEKGFRCSRHSILCAKIKENPFVGLPIFSFLWKVL